MKKFEKWRLMGNSRSPPLPLFPKTLDNLQHLLSPPRSINVPPAHTHADLFLCIRRQQPLQQQMPHLHTHKNPAIAIVLLLRTVLEIDKLEASPQQLTYLLRRESGFLHVGRVQAVVMESDAVNDADEEERPVGAAFCDFDVAAVVDGEEDVRCLSEVWEGVFEGQGVGCLH